MITEEEIERIIKEFDDEDRFSVSDLRIMRHIITRELLGKRVPQTATEVQIMEASSRYDTFVRKQLEKPKITREEIEKWCKGLKPINTTADIHRIRSSIVVFCEDH